MDTGRVTAWAAGLVIGLAVAASAAGADDPAREDEQTLAAAHLGTDDPALLDFFRKHTPADADRDKVRALIAALGDDSYRIREHASDELVALGATAAPLLRDAL